MDSDRLARYLAGEASPDDHASVVAWTASNPSNQNELDRLVAAWRHPGQPGVYDLDLAWAQVAGRLGQAVADPEPVAIPLARRPMIQWLAAAAVVMATGSVMMLRTRDRDVGMSYSTTIGEQKTVTLPDGSTAVLAPASTLVVAPGYGRPNRRLSLTGRAWFEVSHDDARPFQVSAGGMIVEDLGTEFEVVTTGPGLQVTVVSGSVAVHRGGGSATVTLGPRDVATISPEGGSSIDHQVPVDRMISWRQGTLDFIDRPLGEVVAELQRWYHVELALAPGLADRPLNAPIPTGNLTEALEIITTALGLIRSDLGPVITLAPKP